VTSSEQLNTRHTSAWSDRCSPAVDDIIRLRSDPADRIWRATVISSTAPVRRAERVGLWSAAVRDVHSWAPLGGQQPWSYLPPVCWRLSNLSDTVGRRRTDCCGTFLLLSNRRRGMDGQQPATPETNKDSGHVDGFQTATTEDRHRGNK